MQRDPVTIFFEIVVLLFAISVHESAHAWMANRLGDPTAKMLGRISLNPIVHIDIFGTLLLPAMLILAGFPPFGHPELQEPDARRHPHGRRGPTQQFLNRFCSSDLPGDRAAYERRHNFPFRRDGCQLAAGYDVRPGGVHQCDFGGF